MSILQNTKILPSSFKIPNFIKSIGQLLQFLSHQLVVFFSIKLFVTPIGYPIPKREQTMFKSAQKNMLSIPKIRKKVHVLSYGYSKKKVLLAHGWAGRSTQLFIIADKLLENGYMIISFDAPAHGKSTGKTTNMPEYIETLNVILKEFGPFEAAIGHSFGSMALLNVQAKTSAFKALVSIGSADLISEIIQRYIKNLGLKPIIAKKMQRSIEKKWNIKIDSFASNLVAKKIKIPTLVVHDTKDGDVPVSCSEKIRLNLKKGTLLITHGLGHTKILRDQKTMSKILNFIIKNT